MPYITRSGRQMVLTATVKQLAEAESLPPGDLNFAISTIIWTQFKNKRRYAVANELMGVLECVKQEFYRRHVVWYENEALHKNGDLEI